MIQNIIIKEFKSDRVSSGDRPTKIMKQFDFAYKALTKSIIKESINSSFSDLFKIANATPVYNTKDFFDKTNYRTISILPLLPKVYEKSLFKQLSVHANKFLCHRYITEHCMLYTKHTRNHMKICSLWMLTSVLIKIICICQQQRSPNLSIIWILNSCGTILVLSWFYMN